MSFDPSRWAQVFDPEKMLFNAVRRVEGGVTKALGPGAGSGQFGSGAGIRTPAFSAWEPIAEVIPNGTATLITLANIPSRFRHLALFAHDMRTDANNAGPFYAWMRCNGDATNRYAAAGVYGSNGSAPQSTGAGGNFAAAYPGAGFYYGNTGPAGGVYSNWLIMPHSGLSSVMHTWFGASVNFTGTYAATADTTAVLWGAVYNPTAAAAISQLDIGADGGGNWAASNGSRVTLYGVY